MWPDFKYENISTFYFYCEKVRHFERDCSNRIRDAKKMKVLAGQYGEWLKADQQRVGSRRTTLRVQEKEQHELTRDQIDRKNNVTEGMLVEKTANVHQNSTMIESEMSLS